MRRSCLTLAVSLLFAAAPAWSESRDPAPAVDLTPVDAAAGEQAALAQARRDFPALFAAAYARHPQLPAGSLEAIAYVQSRWVMLDGAVDAVPESPAAVGLMGLYAGHGFRDQVGGAATLLGVSRKQVESDPYWNVLGAAALLADAQSRLARGATQAELLAAYAGHGDGKTDAIAAFAREAFAYDVLLTLDRGVDDNGIRVDARPVAWEREFAPDALLRQRAPFVRLDLQRGAVEVDGLRIDPVTEALSSDAPLAGPVPSSTDYGPALWVTSPYYHSRSQSISAVAIHTMQGSYAGSISWFQSNPYSVSAHYLIRSSDGQVTQMVREAQAAHHIGAENGYTLGIEHEGYVNNASWYTTAMYNASSALTRHFCSRHGINCATAYNGAAHSGVVVLSSSIKIKGHQHFPNNTHTDPGINWDWRRYYTLLNPGSGGGTPRILDTFETNEGHFTSTPSYSGSTTGIDATSTAERDCGVSHVGSCSEHLTLVDNPSDSQAWAVRFLSGGGSAGSNTGVARNGRVGFWVYVAGAGFSVGVGIDDGAATERSTLRSVAANTWTYVEWNLADANQWNAWVGGNGAIDAANVTIDAIWLERAHTTYTVNAYIDEVQWRSN
ncbi:MAG TPA: peptidoglycan recognition family protein [Tahibacter sp.]|uniref:N-acetylmuramoyl-L-alanine amidase n=1 Tax=Tahibacter sp. TaxID=2056211 RepID=UPI002CAA390E|nr:peptidoglycan recognition family protein [Tahibacter sp.]HSX62200.1 peptidoglycan recognition family protein [Tahibacter sp.]